MAGVILVLAAVVLALLPLIPVAQVQQQEVEQVQVGVQLEERFEVLVLLELLVATRHSVAVVPDLVVVFLVVLTPGGQVELDWRQAGFPVLVEVYPFLYLWVLVL